MIYLIYFSEGGTPKTGLSPTCDVYIKVSNGASAGSAPSVSELSGGFYKFSAIPTEATAIRIDSNDAAMSDQDRYITIRISENDNYGLGIGALSCTWTQKDDGGTPMDNVNVWVTLDEAGTNIIAGSLITNTSGEVTFMLDAGSYYVWRERGGYNFTNPQTWSVS